MTTFAPERTATGCSTTDSLEDPGDTSAGRIAAARLTPPLLRQIAVRRKPSAVGGGLTAKDKVTDAEPW